MGWATKYIQQLKECKEVVCRPKGNSMQPKINSGDLCKIEPLQDEPKVGEIVLCKVKGRQFLHLVSAKRGNQFQISNNKGFVNGWITKNSIFGRCTEVSK